MSATASGKGTSLLGVTRSPTFVARAPVISGGSHNVAMEMASLDGVNLAEIFKQRARVMRTVPLFLKGAFRSAMQEEAQCARDRNRRQ